MLWSEHTVGRPVWCCSLVWSTNPLERVNKEIERRTDVVGIFPNEAPAGPPHRAVLIEIHDEWQVTEQRYGRFVLLRARCL